jgi:hypothetical protein
MSSKENAPVATSSFFGPIGGSSTIPSTLTMKRNSPPPSNATSPSENKRAKHSTLSSIPGPTTGGFSFSVPSLSSFNIGLSVAKNSGNVSPTIIPAGKKQLTKDTKDTKDTKQRTQPAEKQVTKPSSPVGEKQVKRSISPVAVPPKKAAAAKRNSVAVEPIPAPMQIDSINTPIIAHAPAHIAASSVITPAPIASTSTIAVRSAVPASSSVHPSPIPSHSHSTTAVASSLLSDFHYSVNIARVLEEKDAAYEQLLTQHRKLKEQKKAELGALVDGAAQAAEQHVRSGAAMVAHWKAECTAAAAATAAEHKQLEVTQAKLRAQEEETQQYIDQSAALAKQLEEMTKKCKLGKTAQYTALSWSEMRQDELKYSHVLPYCK